MLKNTNIGLTISIIQEKIQTYKYPVKPIQLQVK